MDKIVNITNKMCPYARKASIVLREKSSNFKEVEVDLNNKSEYFKESYSKAIGKNPNKDGLVPIIIDDGVYLSESQPIVWYIAQKFRDVGYDVIPKSDIQKFKMRIFIQQFVKKIISVQSRFFGWSKKSEQQKTKQFRQVDEFLQNLQTKLILPYALGDQFTIADILIYSHLELWPTLQHYTGKGIDKKYEKIHKYIDEVQRRDSVKQRIQPTQAYIEVFKKFI